MTKRKKLFTLLMALCLMSATLVWAAATSHTYTDTTPWIEHKTLVTGAKSNGTTYAPVSLSSSSQSAVTLWIDYQPPSSSWTLCTSNYPLTPGQSTNMSYWATPAVSSPVRLRLGQVPIGDAGKAVSGAINFN